MLTLAMSLPPYFGWVLASLLLAGILSVALRKIDAVGAFTGVLIGLSLYLGGDGSALFLLGAFFVIGSAATSWKIERKKAAGLAEGNTGKRSARNALANGGVAALLGLGAWFSGQHSLLFQTMIAASFASATSDTLSSELGNIYGSRYWNILTGRPGIRGEDGVVSREGFLFGLFGSGIMALLFGFFQGVDLLVPAILLAGMAGNLSDSVLGASMQRQEYLDNHGVNLVSTAIAAMIGGALYWVLNT